MIHLLTARSRIQSVFIVAYFFAILKYVIKLENFNFNDWNTYVKTWKFNYSNDLKGTKKGKLILIFTSFKFFFVVALESKARVNASTRSNVCSLNEWEMDWNRRLLKNWNEYYERSLLGPFANIIQYFDSPEQ